MEKLPAGGQAYYTTDWIGVIQLCACALYGCLVVPQLNLDDPKDTNLIFLAIFLGIYACYLLYKLILTPPLVVTLPDRVIFHTDRILYWKKTELLWEQIDRFYLDENLVRYGRRGSNMYVKVKWLIIVSDSGQFVKLKNFDSLLQTEREQIIQTFLDHNIPQRSRNTKI